jgi:hypothetical protein
VQRLCGVNAFDARGGAMTNGSKHIRQLPKAWQEGFNAGRRWFPRKNPYPIDSDEALAWISGFIEGKTKQHPVMAD